MGEVLLSVELPGAHAPQRDAFFAALAERRWDTLLRGGALACHFEHGFIAEVRRIVHQDLFAAAQRACVQRWRAAHVWSAPGHFTLSSEDGAGESHAHAFPASAGRAVWTDDGPAVGPIADVLLVLHRSALETRNTGRLRAALVAGGWAPLDGLRNTFRHAFDLGMFEPIGPRVRSDVSAAAASAGLLEWSAVCSLSTWDCEQLEGPPRARRVRPLPWDSEP